MNRIGISFALVSALLFGASTPLAKLLLGSVSPWMLAGLLYLGAGLGLGVAQVCRAGLGRQPSEAPLRAADLPWLCLIIACGGILGPLLLMLGLTGTDAAAASLLLNLEGVATLAIAWLWFREYVDRRLFLGAVAILAGAALLSWRGGGSFGWTSLLIAGACLSWGIDNNLTRKLSSADPIQLAMLKGLAAGAINTALAFASGAHWPTAGTLLATGVIGFLGYGVSLALFVLALRHLGSARAGAYFSIAPFAGAVISIVLLADAVSVQLLLAGGLMAVGLWLHLSERHDHEHTHEAMAHEHRHVHDEHHRHDHGPGDPPGEPHSHWHRHHPMVHRHAHYPDLHHRHGHKQGH